MWTSFKEKKNGFSFVPLTGLNSVYYLSVTSRICIKSLIMIRLCLFLEKVLPAIIPLWF